MARQQEAPPQRVRLTDRDPSAGLNAKAAQFARALDEAARRAAARPAQRAEYRNPWRFPEFPPQAIPPKHLLAQDQGLIEENFAWAGSLFRESARWYPSAIAEGTTFLGYPYLAELALRAEYRNAVETIAEEMTREWIEVKVAGDDEQRTKTKNNEKVKVVNDELKRLRARETFKQVARYDGFFGRGHIYLDTGHTDDKEELRSALGNGRNLISKAKFVGDPEALDKIGKYELKALRPVEPYWAYPLSYEAVNPLKGTWYKPTEWFVMGTPVHESRLLRFVSREVPDIFKPVFAFGGLSLSQVMKPYVDNWLKIRQGVADIITAFSIMVLMTDLNVTLMQGSEQLFSRIQLFDQLRDNFGAMVLNKDSEDLKNVSAPIGGLGELQAQAQEHLFSVSRIPGVKFAGIQPSGLNASSEGEIRTFYDNVKGYQESIFREPLTCIIGMIQLAKFNEVDPDIVFDFKDLWQLDAATKTSIQVQKAQTHDSYLASGVVVVEEVREAVAADPDSPYAGLDLAHRPLPTPMPGEEAEGGLFGPNPPQQVHLHMNPREREPEFPNPRNPHQQAPRTAAQLRHPSGGPPDTPLNRPQIKVGGLDQEAAE